MHCIANEYRGLQNNGILICFYLCLTPISELLEIVPSFMNKVVSVPPASVVD